MKKNKAETKSFLREWMGYVLYDEELQGMESRRVCVHAGPIAEFTESLLEIGYSPDQPANLNKAIEEAKAWVKQLKRCRECGCTEFNCKQCIAKDGHPCHWIEEDLCSSCKSDPVIKVTDERAVNNIPLTNNNDMKFFEQLAASGNVDITIRIMEKDGKLTVELMPGTKTTLKPFIATGTPQELDEGFFDSLIPGLNEIKGLVTNLEEVKASAKNKSSKASNSNDDNDETTDDKKSQAKKAEAKKSAVKKPIEKKGAEKKVVKPAATKEVKEEIEKPDLFPE